MPLDPAKLRKVRPHADGGFTAQCPVCAEAGGDSVGVHLRQFPDGRFACAACQGDGEHRRAVYARAGDKDALRADPGARRGLAFRRGVERRTFNGAHRILERPWTPGAIQLDSPDPVPSDPMGQALALVGLFRPLDQVWTGDHFDSGQQRHANHFRPARKWVRAGIVAGPRICPSAFIPGTIVRAERAVRCWRFLVVESDSLSKPEQGAVLRWLRDRCFFRLRAVVDTAGRSLHGWFDRPPRREIEILFSALPKLRLDAAVARASQPCRLPGWPRDDTGALPSLLYLDRAP